MRSSSQRRPLRVLQPPLIPHSWGMRKRKYPRDTLGLPAGTSPCTLFEFSIWSFDIAKDTPERLQHPASASWRAMHPGYPTEPRHPPEAAPHAFLSSPRRRESGKGTLGLLAKGLCPSALPCGTGRRSVLSGLGRGMLTRRCRRRPPAEGLGVSPNSLVYSPHKSGGPEGAGGGLPRSPLNRERWHGRSVPHVS